MKNEITLRTSYSEYRNQYTVTLLLKSRTLFLKSAVVGTVGGASM